MKTRLLPLFLILLGAPHTLRAQADVSSLRGVVHDTTGAVIPDVQIRVSNLQTNVTRDVIVPENGEFEVIDLRSGAYRLTATKPGFKTFVADNIILESRQIRRIDVTLEVGQVETQVEVSANAAVIETESAKIQSGFTNIRYDNFPTVSNFFDPNTMLATLPLVQSQMGSYNLTFAGQGPSQIQEGMDGVTNDGIVNQINNMEDTAELQAVIVNSPAEYSRVGNFNLTTKSGSNQFHGRGFYYQENSALNARDFFDQKKTRTLIHTFGGQAGGPIKRDRTFFFASWNAMRLPSKSFYTRTVPTEAFRSGDFSNLLSLANPVMLKDPSTGAAFPGNRIPSNRFSPVSQKVQDTYFPKPNIGGPSQLTNNYFFQFAYPADLHRAEYITGRIDHNFSSNHSLSGRYSTNWFYYVLPGNYPGLEWTRLRHNHHLAVTDTYILSSHIVNTLKVGYYNEKYNDGDTVDGFTPIHGDAVVKAIGLQGVNSQNLSAQGFPRINVTGYGSLQVRAGGPAKNEKTYNFADNMTWTFGSHVVKFGGELRKFSEFNGSVPEGTYGAFDFNGSFTGNAYADFLLGIPFQSQRLSPLTNRTRRSYELGLFVQDTFKVSSRLSLDYGLRWDYFGAPSYADGLMYRWDQQADTVFVPKDALGKVSPLYPTSRIRLAAGDAAWVPKKSNFQPRIGLAYRLNPATVIRGGYGIYSESLGRYARLLAGGPFELTETFVNQFTNGQPLLAFPNPFPDGRLGNVPSQSITGFQREADNGRIHQFNISFERQWKDIGLRFSYVGSRGKGLNYNLAINKPEPSLIPFTATRRPYPQFVNATYARNNGETRYNAFAAEAVRKFARGITFQSHWTWASSLANYLNLENPYAPLFWNRDAYTPRHRVSVNAIYELPFGNGRGHLANAPAAVNMILGGWNLYYLSYFQTGSFFTPRYDGADPSNTNTSGGIPDRIADGNLPPGQRSINRWFDVSAFARPAAGRFGNSGVNVLEGPGLHVHHLTIAKDFRITEKVSLKYELVMSNLFNHPNFHFPNANISAPGQAGVIGATYGGGDTFNLEKAANRRMETRLRIVF
ncbi:MAG TPA: TonB-dependent receptor [Bryobacteraceae bacterium]|nr:TonB-dependent receptor [Bryobacteraceae bacterium]